MRAGSAKFGVALQAGSPAKQQAGNLRYDRLSPSTLRRSQRDGRGLRRHSRQRR